MFKYELPEPDTEKNSLWLFKEDFVGHKPCLLRDGRIRTATHDFANEQELRRFLKKLAPVWMFNTKAHGECLVQDNAIPNTRAIQRWLGAMAGLDTQCPDTGISNLSWDSAGPLTDEDAPDKDWIFASAPNEADPELYFSLDFEFETCPSAMQDGDIDRSLLRSSRPELSTFISSYPLTANQASILSTILNNIDHVNVERLFTALLPSFVEAVECGIARKIADDELVTDYQDVEDWMLDIIGDITINGIDRLPTLREVLSKNTVVQLWK